jgi:glycerol-3-phosphate dehydrogenase
MAKDIKPDPRPADEFSMRTRSANIAQMEREEFDIAVIGGGITGAGIALDAALRGLSVALVEKRDFASGTSSRSSKLIHGGLRYLEQFHFGLVRESLHERAVLSRMAPHLSEPLPFLVPLYASSDRSPLGSNKLKLSVGLWLYDSLAGKENIERHCWLSPDEVVRLAPAIDREGLRGAFLYYDCLTDDARLVIEVIKAAANHGAFVANYAAVQSIHTSHRSTNLQIEDGLTKKGFELRARIVVNAAGVWSDEVSRLSDPTAPSKLRPSKGIHIVLPSGKFKSKTAALIPSLGENRFLFVIPWQGRIVVGTTDEDYVGDLDEPRAEESEIERIMKSVARAFPLARLSREDVISTFAGLRPLIASNGNSTKDLSRREEIFESESGLLTITGGKLTTFRRMAERVVGLAVRRLETLDRVPREHRSSTENVQLAADSASEVIRAAPVAREFGVSVFAVEHLIECYGTNYRAILELTRESDLSKSNLIEGLPHIEAEVVYAARHEMAATVEDFLSRRTRLALLARDHGSSCAERVASLLAREFN